MYVLERTSWYNALMEVPITRFRREIFSLVNQALEGQEVWVTHKGRRVRIVPEGRPVSRLSRITPMNILNPEGPDLNDPAFKAGMLAEMETAWESDWSTL
jgi:antitoxin (DNA-binding transcriptional repressor) of toxin-antitoxin stability system